MTMNGFNLLRSVPRTRPAAVLVLLLLLSGALHAVAQEAQWIWSPEHRKDNVPPGACHFRKTLELSQPNEGRILIAADDTYELFLNGRVVGRGQSSKKLKEYDVTRFLSRGTNTIAIKVTNQRGRTAALAARVMVKDNDQQWRTFSTDPSWRTNLRPLPLWNTTLYNDRRWAAAQSFGQLGDTAPWDREENVASEQRERTERFNVVEEFEVRRIVDAEQTESLIALTFNEFGNILASREGGPLLIIPQDKKSGAWGSVRTYCDRVKNCQGILALNGDVYVTADGPEGSALYRLSDGDQDGELEQVQALLRFTGPAGEHGAHGLALGPDGWLYVMLGNHASLDRPYSDRSPHRNYYEGDLVGPRYEDPTGHAAGVTAPGGCIFRTDLAGQHVELVCGGVRNSYDLAFNREGDLFLHDSDMESDEGTPWYRPTMLLHAIPGGEYGWRSGWAKWPEYYVDSLPPMLETGRGSPTGIAIYEHFGFPKRYHNAIFTADWTGGRILAVKLKPNGASFTANSEVFIEGSPLNVTDLEVGPDGALYFVTGGRGTGGGIYRVSWKGVVPDAVKDLGAGITTAIRHPQLNSAWGRQRIATLKEELGPQWGKMLTGVARSAANPPQYRIRALDLMQLFGPPPAAELLCDLAGDNTEIVRGKAAELMGLHASEQTHRKLLELLGDSDRQVRRRACEALARAGQSAPVDKVLEMVASDDRHEAWAARRLLERLPVDEWRDTVLESQQPRVFLQGSLALLLVEPTEENALAVLQQSQQRMQGFMSDRDFVDLLRVLQVALHRTDVPPDSLAELGEQLADEFPAGNHEMNRELVRLLVYLQISSPIDRYFAYLESDVPEAEKLHLALHLRYLDAHLTTQQKLELLSYYETAQRAEGGGSYVHYLRNVARDLAKSLSSEESAEVLARADEWPSAALGALYTLPDLLDDETREQLISLDRRLTASGNPENARALQVGLIAVLARSGDEPSWQYLREVWDESPDRRAAVAMGLAQAPDGENWTYLVRSLPVLEGPAAHEVIQKLLTVAKAPAESEYIRQVILAGYKLQDQGAYDAVALLEYWTGEQPAELDADWQQQMEAWSQWFAEHYPDMPEAKLPVSTADSKWHLDELLTYLTSDEAAAASESRGAQVFVKAQCSKCHRVGSAGEQIGPDLTTLTKRFTRKETLESILFPSHVISDQYATKVVVTTAGKVHTGMATLRDEDVTILQSDGTKIDISGDDIEEVRASNKSAMPEGLLDTLSEEEIADLFAYLGYRTRTNVARTTGNTSR